MNSAMIFIATPASGLLPGCLDHLSRREFYRSRSQTVFCKSSRLLHPNASESPSSRTCECFDFHKDLIPYGVAWTLQKDIVREKEALINVNEECSDALIVLQHHPVFTMGTGSTEEFLNFDPDDSPHPIYRTERGGEVTYHGPGQLVMYPIINLRNHKMDLHWYLRALEKVVIRVLSSTFSINAYRLDGLTGVWAGNKKLAAIGIRASKWITFHGLALNVTTDLTPFNWIVPCGIRNREVGNIKQVLGEVHSHTGFRKLGVDPNENSELIDITYEALLKEFSQVFQLDIIQRSMPVSEFMNHSSKSSTG